jgi:hypothetical protein
MDAQESGKRDAPPDASRQPSRRRHLLIAGTGRSGTSALVQYLTRLGLETHLSKNSESRQWSNASQSGFEDIPMSAIASELPYVIKFPWAYEFIEDLLVEPQIELEAVILPMRDLMKAAASRTIVQLRAVHDHAPWMAKLPKTWEDWALTPGGTIFSLNPSIRHVCWRLVSIGCLSGWSRQTYQSYSWPFRDWSRIPIICSKSFAQYCLSRSPLSVHERRTRRRSVPIWLGLNRS